MAIALKKGGRLNLSKKEPSLKKAMIGLGWEVLSGNPLDLDASIFMIGPNGKLPADEYFVFYNNLKSPDGSLRHNGDNRSGVGDGDDETILVNLPAISPLVTELIIVVSIHDAEVRRHHFGLMKEAYIRIVDVETDRVVLSYDLDEEFGRMTDIEFGRLSLQNGEWYFTASGLGSNMGLQGYVDRYA